MAKQKLPPNLADWVSARRRYRLSHAQVQMARELGMNPRKLGGIANHEQERWKAPLPQFIEALYEKRFGRPPENVRSIEELARAHQEKRAARKAAKKERRDREAELRAGTGVAGADVAGADVAGADVAGTDFVDMDFADTDFVDPSPETGAGEDPPVDTDGASERRPR